MARPKGFKLSPDSWDDITRLTGLTLTQVAETADVPRSTLSSLLGGHHRASSVMCQRIAAAMTVHAVTLFHGLDSETLK
jgi:plasmid maintenance system antidote protein VapI